jgi:hypothetical protein
MDSDAPDAGQAWLRFGWLSFPLAIAQVGADLCIAPHGTGAWRGPLVAGAGADGGLREVSVTSYQPVPPARYDVRLLPPGNPSCSVDGGAFGTPGGPDGGPPVLPLDFTDLPALVAGESYTLAFFDGVVRPTQRARPRGVHGSVSRVNAHAPMRARKSLGSA